MFAGLMKSLNRDSIGVSIEPDALRMAESRHGQVTRCASRPLQTLRRVVGAQPLGQQEPKERPDRRKPPGTGGAGQTLGIAGGKVGFDLGPSGRNGVRPSRGQPSGKIA